MVENKETSLEEREMENIIKKTIEDMDIKKMMDDPNMKKIMSDAEDINRSYQEKLIADFRKVIKEELNIVVDEIRKCCK
ncbi:hypothetical protein GUI12_00320 [Anaplasmataceae bacterium AB001_6]|nr:hypothetical protein GUI12_00320 [Anaplasmataceae bacterium AB001_6]